MCIIYVGCVYVTIIKKKLLIWGAWEGLEEGTWEGLDGGKRREEIIYFNLKYAFQKRKIEIIVTDLWDTVNWINIHMLCES